MSVVGASVDEIREAAKTLGLPDRIDEQSARQAYSAYIRKWHPDVAMKQGISADEANKRAAEGNKAYTVIKAVLAENGGSYEIPRQVATSSTQGNTSQGAGQETRRARSSQTNANTGSAQGSRARTTGSNESTGGTSYWDVQEQRWKVDPTGQRSGWYDRKEQQQGSRTRQQNVNQGGNAGRRSASTSTGSGSSSQTSSSSSSASAEDLAGDMVDSTMKPVSEIAFKDETFPAKVLHAILTVIQVLACIRVAIPIFAYLVPSQANSVDDVIGYLLRNLMGIGIGMLGALIGGFINLWLIRLVARFFMKLANRYAIVALILDALIIWLVAQSVLSVLPADAIQQMQEMAKSVAPNLGM